MQNKTFTKAAGPPKLLNAMPPMDPMKGCFPPGPPPPPGGPLGYPGPCKGGHMGGLGPCDGMAAQGMDQNLLPCAYFNIAMEAMAH
eukprot:s976_g20.t1